MASPVKRDPVGPLRFAALVKINEALFWDKTRPPAIGPLDTDFDHLIRVGERHSLLAFDELNDDALGHLILERNGMRLWPNDFVPGITIQIPTRESLVDRGLV